MAKIYDKSTSDIGKVTTPITYFRSNPAPIDQTTIYTTLTEAETYASSGANAYVGQQITVTPNSSSEKISINDGETQEEYKARIDELVENNTDPTVTYEITKDDDGNYTDCTKTTSPVISSFIIADTNGNLSKIGEQGKIDDVTKELSNAISSKVAVIVGDDTTEPDYVDTLSVYKLSPSEYQSRVEAEEIDSKSLYIISADNFDVLGQQIKHLKPGSELSDAVNVEQIQTLSNDIETDITQTLNDQYRNKTDLKLYDDSYVEIENDLIAKQSEVRSLIPTEDEGEYTLGNITTQSIESEARLAAQYPLVTLTATEEDTTLVYNLENCSINIITIDDSSKSVKIVFPSPLGSNLARDLVVRIIITVDELPTITITTKDGEDITWESGDDDWETLEKGVNILSFTETQGNN